MAHYRFAVLDNCNTFCIDDWYCTFFPIQTCRANRWREKKGKGTTEFNAASYNRKTVQWIPLLAYETYMVVRNRFWLRLQTNLLHESIIRGCLDSIALFRSSQSISSHIQHYMTWLFQNMHVLHWSHSVCFFILVLLVVVRPTPPKLRSQTAQFTEQNIFVHHSGAIFVRCSLSTRAIKVLISNKNEAHPNEYLQCVNTSADIGCLLVSAAWL